MCVCVCPAFRWKKTLIVVSHDRDFLNSVTTDIIHLHDRKLHFYRGNFAQFEEMFEQRRREVRGTGLRLCGWAQAGWLLAQADVVTVELAM